VITPRALLRNGWSDWHVLGALAMCLIGAVATAGVWRDIWITAERHGETSHLILVPLVAGWLVWVRRERLRLCEPVGTWLGPMLVVVGWLAASLGDTMNYAVFSHAGAVTILIGCILSVVGVDVLRRFAPAFVALLFLIPAPWVVHQNVTEPFNLFVNQASVLVFQLLGVDAMAEERALLIDGVAVPVIAACGAPGFKGILLVAYGFAFAKPLRAWARVVVLLCTPLAAVVTQILGTTLLAGVLHYRDSESAVMWGAILGWLLLLPLVLICLVGVVRVLSWASAPVHEYRLAREG
jgi:exosortase